MADLRKPISILPAASVLDGAELVAVVQAGVTKKAPLSLLRPLVQFRPSLYGAVGDGATDDTAALAACYAAAKAVGGPRVISLDPGFNYLHGPLTWDSNLVSVEGPGSPACRFTAKPAGGKITIKPSPFTVIQGPRISGFTVDDNAAHPASTVGVETGDITGFLFEDVVVSHFSGAGSIGWLLSQAVQTELNTWRRCWVWDNAIGISFTNSNPALNSYARNNFDRFHMNVGAGQVGWKMRDNGNLYGAVLNITANVDGAGTLFDIGGTAQINGCEIYIAAEQTSGTGGVPFVVAATAFVFGYGLARFENFAADGSLTGGARNSPGWRILTAEAIRAGVDSAVEGQLANFLGSGNAANVHPMVWDSLQAPLAAMGFLTGSSIRSPYVCMYDGTNAFVVYKTTGGAPNSLIELFRFTAGAHMVTGGLSSSIANGAALGTAPPAAAPSGTNMKGTIALGSGTTPGTGTACTVTFGNAWPVIPEITLTPIGSASEAVRPYIVSRTATAFVVGFAVAPAASQAVGTYVFAWHAVG